MAYKGLQKSLCLITFAVLTLSMNLGGLKPVLAAGSQPSSELQRPRVNETEGWEKISAWRLTGGSVSEKVIWREKWKILDGKVLPFITVVHSDANNKAEVWFDGGGVHFYDRQSKVIKTPIDLSNCHYDLMTDSSLRFFMVKWRKKNERNRYITLLNFSGEILWEAKTKAPDGCIQVAKPSRLGDVLVGIADCHDDEPIYKMEVWNLQRKAKRLPGFAVDFSWSLDGKKINYKWTDKPRVGKKVVALQQGTFDREGNLLSGNEK